MSGETPPSYNSIFGELKQQKEQSGGIVDYTKNASGVVKSKVGGCCSILMFACCITICSLGLPIAEIVIGALYKDECDAQRYLPIYLIVMGVFSLLTGCSSSGNRISNRKSEEAEAEEEQSTTGKATGCCSGLISLFLLAWFICGNVWVFSMKECGTEAMMNMNTTMDCYTTDVMYADSPNYCRQLLYDFVFYETIARWAVLGLILSLSCTCCFVMCCVYCCSSK